MELLGSSPIPRSFVACCVCLYLRLLPSTGITRLHRSYEPLRHPIRPGLSLASCQLIDTMITAGASRVASGLLCVHAVAITPAGSMELVRSSVSIASGLPRVTVRSAPAIVFSRPAQRSLTLRPARSRSRHATLSIESSDSFVASTAASIATGWSEPVPGRELHPLKSSAFHGALLRQLSSLGATFVGTETRKLWRASWRQEFSWFLVPASSLRSERSTSSIRSG